ncbi:uncharacterized protein LOC119453786 isoform X7 [Dermacentor silvarum]|uniref:uncharacterized protein LOC119453786 isoform X7 n=1 Tax=Dermacentor silvarum TaxID=543639 RepID=UPI0018999A49|nr:uncharacterized protein LOC119453786 isoform X7 [Dermacentor silvarum]
MTFTWIYRITLGPSKGKAMRTWFCVANVIYVLAFFCHAKRPQKSLQPPPLTDQKPLKPQTPEEKMQLVKQMEKRKGPRIDRTQTYMHVRSSTKMEPLFVVNAYMGNKIRDPKVSGRYTILYATKACFIISTGEQANASKSQGQGVAIPAANASKSQDQVVGIPAGGTFSHSLSCGLWRLGVANETERIPCRNEYRRLCKQGLYKFVFTDMCRLAKNVKITAGPATPKVN